MTYLVWELISVYDGLAETACPSWEAALVEVDKIIKDRLNSEKVVEGIRKVGPQIKVEYNKWLRGEVTKVSVEGPTHTEFQVFVTTEMLPGNYAPT